MKIIFPTTDLPRVVIVGGGFGGIKLALALRKAPVQIIMLDRHNYHTFQPLLYQVATGGLEPDSIAFPLRKVFEKQANIFFRIAEVMRVEPENKRLFTNIGELEYDYLVLATGSETNFFGMEDIKARAMGMKTIPESLDLRSLILQNFEIALQEDVVDRNLLMKFVVVGGGPTGVETAGALAELKNHILPNDYPELNFGDMEIRLVEASPRLLAAMKEKSSADARISLEKLGVKVHVETQVKSYDGSHVVTADGTVFEAGTMIWAAGIKGKTIDGMDSAIERGQRLAVDPYNRVRGFENIFAVGDLAVMVLDDYPRGHPQVAPVAMQQGTLLGKNLLNLLKGAPLKPFKYFDKGSMATIGRNKAVMDIGPIHLNGIIAWLGWMFVHILFLIGFRNKLVVFINWVWSYFTYDKGTRLIIRPFKRRQQEAMATEVVS